MKNNIEIEYKCVLNPNDYQKLWENYQNKETVIQINHYFDTAELMLHQQRSMMRIREINQQFLFTFKEVCGEHRQEHELILPSCSLDYPEIQQFIQKRHISQPLMPLGTLTTQRTMWQDNYGTWCLDRNWYFDQEDYELEYELFTAQPVAYQKYIDFLNSQKIPYKKAAGKYSRFIKQYKISKDQ